MYSDPVRSIKPVLDNDLVDWLVGVARDHHYPVINGIREV
jgi:hypothetical protein